MEVSDLNKLLKMQRQMSDVMKKMGKGGMLKQAMRGMFGKGMPDPSELSGKLDLKALQKAAKILEICHQTIFLGDFQA